MEAGGLAGAPEGTFYEGWVHDGVSWVSVGTFHMRDPGPVSLWSGVSLREFSHLVVTLESVDGDPAPSHDVVLEGRIPAQAVGGGSAAVLAVVPVEDRLEALQSMTRGSGAAHLV